MWSCGAELCCPGDTCSPAGQGNRRLALHYRASPLLLPSFPAQILEAFRKYCRLILTLFTALPFTFQTHQLLFTTPEQPNQDPSGRINSQAAPVPHAGLVNPSSILTAAPRAVGEACWDDGSLGSQLFFLPGAHPGNTLCFSFLQVKVFEAEGATEMLRPAPGALARTPTQASPTSGHPRAASPAPRGPARRTPRGHRVGPRRAPAGRPGVGQGASSGPEHRPGGCWGHGGGARRAGDPGEAGMARQRGRRRHDTGQDTKGPTPRGVVPGGGTHSPRAKRPSSLKGKHTRARPSRTHRPPGAPGPRRSPRCRRRPHRPPLP